MRAVNTARTEESVADFRFHMIRRFARNLWLPAAGFAALVVVGTWLSLHNHRQQPTPGSTSLPEISTAFTAGQEVVDALPSVTVGPLSDELDKVNLDVSRTASFLLATLP